MMKSKRWARRVQKAEGALILLGQLKGRVLVPLRPDRVRMCVGPFEYKEFCHAEGVLIDPEQPVCDETEIGPLRGVKIEPVLPEVFVLGAIVGGGARYDGAKCWFTLDDFIDGFMDGRFSGGVLPPLQ